MEYNKHVSKPGRKLMTSSPSDVIKRQRAQEGDTRLIEELRGELNNLRDHFTTATGGLSPEEVDNEIRTSVNNAIRETKQYYEERLAESKAREEGLKVKIRELKDVNSVNLNKEVERSKELLGSTKLELEKQYRFTISSLQDSLKLAEDKIAQKDLEVESLKAEKDSAIHRILEEQNRRIDDLVRNISLEKLGVDDIDRPKMEHAYVDPSDDDSGFSESHIELADVSTTTKEIMQSKVDRLRNLMGSFADKN
jgi:hypothetical protein